MSTYSAAYLSTISTLPPGTTIHFPNVSWSEYEQWLDELQESPQVKLTYDHGTLEITMPSPEHEALRELFPHLIAILAEELGVEFGGLGSTTLKRLMVEGTEPDGCFYLHNWQRVIGKKRIDLENDPPPDLAIEIDITNPSLNKLAIYADLGVAELWRYTKNHVIFYRLAGESYEIVEDSELFPFLSPAVIEAALQTGLTIGSTTMRINFRQWVQTHKE